MPYDLLILDAQIIDGTGAPAFAGDIAVHEGKIAEIGKPRGSARRVIDAKGATVTPGFIDAHTHMDVQILWDPLATSSCWHGITTILMGNCSFGVAPCRPADHKTVLQILERVEGMSLAALTAGVDWSWESFPEYLSRIEGKLGLNVATLVGHSAVRQYVMGNAASERAASPAEISAMRETLCQALAAGAYGMSFNFNPGHVGADGRPIPSRLATFDEVLAMASTMRGKSGGLIQVAFNPKPGEDPLSAYDEISRAGECPVWWMLVQLDSQPGVWKQRLADSIRLIAGGSRIRGMTTSRTIDVVFTMKNAHIFDTMPAWVSVLTKSPIEIAAALQRSEVRSALQRDFDDPLLRPLFCRRWDRIEVVKTSLDRLKHLERRKISAIAAEQGLCGLDAFLDLCLEDNLDTEFLTVLANGDEEAVAEILLNPDTLIGLSDAGAHAALECGYGFSTHLLGHWVREKKTLSLHEAVRKLTSMIADQMGLTDRGRIRPGLAADLNILDPSTVNMLQPVPVNDFPGGAKRFIQKSIGISHTIVNGQILMENGEHVGSYPGQLLRRS